jgi:hypothetical protein
MKSSTQSERATMKIRLPRDLKDWLEDRSIRNFRAMNAELVAILSTLRKGEDEDPEGFRRFANQ